VCKGGIVSGMESGWEFQFQERMKSGGELSKLTNKQKHTFVPPPHTTPVYI
jgi:hypothetical protein